MVSDMIKLFRFAVLQPPPTPGTTGLWYLWSPLCVPDQPCPDKQLQKTSVSVEHTKSPSQMVLRRLSAMPARSA